MQLSTGIHSKLAISASKRRSGPSAGEGSSEESSDGNLGEAVPEKEARGGNGKDEM